MQPASPGPVDASENCRLACSRCGSRMMLVRIESSDEPGRDLQTFECLCGRADRVKIKFKQRLASHDTDAP